MTWEGESSSALAEEVGGGGGAGRRNPPWREATELRRNPSSRERRHRSARHYIRLSSRPPRKVAIYSQIWMETINFGSSVTQAKFIDTVVLVAGAIIVTLYEGPQILSSPLKSKISKNLIGQPSNWVLGGIFLAIDAVFSSMYIIAQVISYSGSR